MEGRERAPQVSGRRAFKAEGVAGAKALGWAWPAQEPARPVWLGQLGERRAEGLGRGSWEEMAKICARNDGDLTMVGVMQMVRSS